ncbi:pyrroline-5-carboxylate reductase [Polynucleobacter sphagniphilus]|jgi:pyrroline-5-carboxylate reductase|uniref:Pyrroline-5-carboxylate reductase n=1 Tax=Polynucleobacter sphagniphilus TaxID=1743169 RepID=A0AA43S4N4_9BURK|nr:pyrroline-5-carboxylate reductase [Polynucleobacter sphagniphilus]MDF9788692.1 pyrroline-5-carboxylate reductase [Polynucleobacter sphagniphilus]MDH6249196.1 pyrroline-5-carboxylate reductase [Polynucleobacter sphagniphilus]MDH6300169.1 pyrroline-5-carboxylate reductase [Polynucleobacter sphagniphilus]MDH6302740.1 pyrroline-5-carboxylate reductase [Polynucleobacter sphagniphilus]MDH6421666.1 pyrroline-5-carboxylate reductase [Polynucleobacter sphagniphilus]
MNTLKKNLNTHITFIGGGNMGRALISGLLASGFEANQLSVVEANASTALGLHQDYGVQVIGALDQIAFDFSKNNVVVMAIKPQDFNVVAKGLSAKLKHASAPGPLILSIAAGIRIKDMSRWLDHERCVRAMPNTPALIGKGITGLFADAAVNQADRDVAQTICNAVGQAVWVAEEKLMDAVTAVSGSGPAYVFAFLEAMQSSGEKLGLDAATARKLAYATLEGATQLAHNSDEHAGVLRERVTSKGGTTAAALEVMKDHGWHDILEKAINAASQRGKAMGDELGKS